MTPSPPFPADFGWHLDLHTPGNVRVNRRPDPSGLARALKAAGASELITFAKCHFGWSYYPTRVATPHPGIRRGDPFGSVLAACRREGIRVYAYVSFGIDGQAARQHPTWRLLDARGNPLGGHGFTCVCPHSGYLERLMLPQVREICRRYRPDGLWFDTMSALAPCYCRACRRRFLAETGHRLPTREDDPLQGLAGRWRREGGLRVIERVAAAIHAELPGAGVGFNQVGSVPYPEPLRPGVTVLSLDPPTYGPQSRLMGLHAAFGAMAGVPCEVMPTIYNQGWGDWSLATQARLERVAVAVWARGVRVVYGDRLHPDVRLAPPSLRALDFLGKLRRRVRRAFPPAAARVKPDLLILHGPSVTYGERGQYFGNQPRERVEALQGAHALCLDAGLGFGVTPEHRLAEHLGDARLVILPELPSLAAATERALHRHVVRGGRLLAIGRVPRVGRRPLGWLGVREHARPWQDHVYLPAWNPSDLPVLARGDFHRVRAPGARVLARAIPAFDARHGLRYGWGIGPAADRASPFPALVWRCVGKGWVAHLEAPLCSDYARHANWAQRDWFAGLVRRLRVPLRLQVESQGPGLEAVLWEHGRAAWVVLVQHAGEELCGVTGSPRPWMRTVGPVPRQALRVRVEARGRRLRRAACGQRPLRWIRRGSSLDLAFTLDAPWAVLRLDWAP